MDFARLQLEEDVTACLTTFAAGPEDNIAAMLRGLEETEHLRRTSNLVGFTPEITYLVDADAGSPSSLAKITDETTEVIFRGDSGAVEASGVL